MPLDAARIVKLIEVPITAPCHEPAKVFIVSNAFGASGCGAGPAGFEAGICAFDCARAVDTSIHIRTIAGRIGVILPRGLNGRDVSPLTPPVKLAGETLTVSCILSFLPI